jgi:hypothetical protein
MATTNNLKKGLNRKLWEICSIAPQQHIAGSCLISSRHFRQQQLMIHTSTAWLYLPEEDSWIQVPNHSIPSTASGTCGVSTAIGPSGNATAGTATTLTTNINLQRDLRGYKIHITAGPGAGGVVEILSNTTGANSVITANFSATPTTATVYRLLTPRWYVVGAGTLASGSFKYYCYALNTWTTVNQSGILASVSGDSRLMSTPSFIDTDFVSFATGTATSATANTISNSGKAWATNQWTNYQVRITAGTGLGQIRSISSNTGTQITVSANWTTTPDATSQYTIEGNDDYLYWINSGTNFIYRYSISLNSWTQLATRGVTPGNGIGGSWVWDATDTAWKAENSIINGRRLYCLRSNSNAPMDYYDIPSNTWTVDISYAPKTETFTTGTKYVYSRDFIYIHKDGSGRWLRFNVVKSEMDPWSTNAYPSGTANVGDTAFDYVYKDGATSITFIYMLLNSSTVLMRTIVI